MEFLFNDYAPLSCEQALQALQSDAARGLSASEVASRLARMGPNAVPEPRSNPLLRFLKNFWGVTAWMLELTLSLALAQKRALDAGVLAGLLLLNAVLGFAQELRASKALEALRRRLQVKVKVLRDGVWTLVEAPGLVPGDVVRLRHGDFVPADLKLLSGRLEADLSALTGETEPLVAGESDLLRSGSVVTRGEAAGLVLLTGLRSSFGRSVQLVQIARPKLHFEAVVSRVVRWLVVMVATLLLTALAVWAWRGGDLMQIIPLMLILMVSAVPVALPAMFTVTLALGSLELVRHGALVTRLSASEDAARMDVLCTDKTGTLTANRLAVAGLLGLDGAGEEEVLRVAAACSQEANQDPLDLAFLAAAKARGLDLEAWVRTSFTPFEAGTRRTEAVVRDGERTFRVMKGAVDTVLKLCSPRPDLADQARRWADQVAADGWRCLAVAREEGGVYRLVGLAGMTDPPRTDSRATVEALRGLGVKVLMLTGDALSVARGIGRQLGMGPTIQNYHDLPPGVDGAARVDAADGFAGIFPEDKYQVIRALQDRGHVVGMTGDGVNDAPALKQAEVGVAMENATDVAKGAAGIVLTVEGLGALPGIIKVGRSIHQRLETWILNKIIKTFQTVAFVVAAFLVTGRFVVSTFDMVLLLFLVDFVTLALATDRALGSAGPSRWDVNRLALAGARLGLLCVVESLGLLWLGWRIFGLGGDQGRLDSFGFEVLFYFGLATVLVVRERGAFWSSRPSPPLAVALAVDAVLVAALVGRGMPGLAPLPWQATALVLGFVGVFGLFLNDFLKRWVLGEGGATSREDSA